ncbi:YbaY family lipoprotein [Shewanella sp. NIFS-20-20]|uniref:YbaY family lipoprotein n=1 Tax=Shewanella sp. NIFS-20-20 TaxID=2853806 RepID=UPI001C45133A|nr:YbaY family lipoprotein [Shewanella sp. NIFS-20-20]MBV7316803.1 YbaY family lipoprotein [Shewanella sp. NIFS-20-20]
MKSYMKLCMVPVLAMLSLGGCATPDAMVEIQGEVWYRERMILPPDAVLTVQVQDISKADVAAEVLAELERNDVTTPAPFSFVIGKDQFEPGHTYSIAARITLNGELMFINTSSYRIDLNSNEPMSVLLNRVGQ